MESIISVGVDVGTTTQVVFSRLYMRTRPVFLYRSEGLHYGKRDPVSLRLFFTLILTINPVSDTAFSFDGVLKRLNEIKMRSSSDICLHFGAGM